MVAIGVRVLAGVVGLAILAFVVHAAIMASGGYGTPAAPLMMALGAGLAAGALAVGVAWDEGRRALGLCLLVALLAGEAWALLQTGERTISHRDQQQAPLRDAADKRAKALERVEAAEAALAAIGETPRLIKAQKAKTAADAAVVAKAAEKGCVQNCARLLQAQVDAAAADVAAARAEIDTTRAGAAGKVKQARADLALLPLPPSASPLADRLGVEPWKLDLAAAALASVAANGLAAFLLTFAAHGRPRRPLVIDVTPAPPAASASAPAVTVDAAAPAGVRDPRAEADRFARTTFRPSKRGRVRLAEVRAAYRAWCLKHGLDPLPDLEIGAALSALFSDVGLYRRGKGASAVIVGMEWSPRALPLLAKLESVDG
jgi:hypothetical protein